MARCDELSHRAYGVRASALLFAAGRPVDMADQSQNLFL